MCLMNQSDNPWKYTSCEIPEPQQFIIVVRNDKLLLEFFCGYFEDYEDEVHRFKEEVQVWMYVDMHLKLLKNMMIFTSPSPTYLDRQKDGYEYKYETYESSPDNPENIEKWLTKYRILTGEVVDYSNFYTTSRLNDRERVKKKILDENV